MRIKWIELNGFKSFPDRIKIEFNDGITCFVGPNGAGKSNIVDAFRWILGEHNPRILRGERMDEIIFQGSMSKKEKGLAEVTIFLNKRENSDNGKEPQFREYEIKRRLFRTGESIFLINGKNSRLKDIKEIFVSEGVDIRTYAIVDQLKVNDILFRASSRKILLEECSGISLYKMKKAETEVKLQSAKENLQRIEDILGELKNQYSALERQAKKAEKYKRILEELRDLELKTAKAESLYLFREFENTRVEINNLDLNFSKLKDENQEITARIDEYKNKVSLIEKEIQELQNQIIEMEGKKAELERDLAITSQEENNKIDTIERLKDENSYLSEDIEKLNLEREQIRRDLEEIQKRITIIQNSIISHEEVLLSANKHSEEIHWAIEKERKSLFNLSTEIANKRNLFSSTKRNLCSLKNNLASVINRKEDTINRVRQKEKELSDIYASTEKLREVLNREEASLRSQLNRLSQIQENLSDYNQRLLKMKKEEAFLIGKIEALSSEIWDEAEENKLLIDCFEVLPGAEELVELWFDEKLKARLIDSIEEIGSREGRKIFLLKESKKDQKTQEKSELKSIKELINIKEPNLSESIFENIFVVDTLKEAIEKKRENPNFSFVTKEGVVISADGFIRTGKMGDLLKKKRILEDFKAKKEQIISEIEEFDRFIRRITEDKKTLSSQIENTKNNISKIKEEISQLQGKYRDLKRDIEGLRQREKYLETEEKTIQKEIEENANLLEVLSFEIENLSISIDETEAKIEELKEREKEIFKKTEATRELLSASKVELSTLKERFNSKKSQEEKINESLNKYLEKKQKNEQEIIKCMEKIESLRIHHLEKKDRLEILIHEIESIKAKLSEKSAYLSKAREILDSLQLKYKEMNENLQVINSQIGDKRAKERELKIRLESLWNEIYNLYGVDIINLEISPSQVTEQAKERIIQLKTRLKEIGTVDLDVLKEFEEVRDRYNFIIEQQRDIKTSIEELEEAIKKVNNITKRKLRETFEQLKNKFNSIFQELFGGGKAELILTDDSNIIDSEIEIEIQPPGKKMTSVNLLSGGEKTLTALAFIFACLSIRPSPICILDEVDAPLDDPNTLRLRKLIKDLSESTQFLIITHNKLMMECADYIYGVTMQEEGVSTVISLELKEIEAYA